MYALFVKLRWSDPNIDPANYHWRFEGMVETEAERDAFIKEMKEAIERTKGRRIETIGYSVHGLA